MPKPTKKELHQYLDAISQDIYSKNFNKLTHQQQYTIRLTFQTRLHSQEFDETFHDQLLSYFKSIHR